MVGSVRSRTCSFFFTAVPQARKGQPSVSARQTWCIAEGPEGHSGARHQRAVGARAFRFASCHVGEVWIWESNPSWATFKLAWQVTSILCVPVSPSGKAAQRCVRAMKGNQPCEEPVERADTQCLLVDQGWAPGRAEAQCGGRAQGSASKAG